MRDSASRDLAAVFERMRGLGSDNAEADPSEDADADAPVAVTASRASRPASGEDSSADTEVTANEPETTETVVEPLLQAVVFDIRDVNVTPLVTLRLRLPSLSEDNPRQVDGVEAIVSTSGEVEREKMLLPQRSVHESMILSAIKTWRFRPTMIDG